MKLYIIDRSNLIPRFCGDFVDETVAGNFAYDTFDRVGGKSEEDYAFYLVTPDGLKFYYSLEGGFGWELATAES